MTKLAYREARIRALKREILRLETKGKHEKHIAPLRRELRRLEGER